MSILSEYVKSIDARCLNLEEVKQCLLYLESMARHNTEHERSSRLLRAQLYDRLSEIMLARIGNNAGAHRK